MASERLFSFGDTENKPLVRMLSDIKELLYDGVWASSAPEMQLYFMYRDLGLTPEDRRAIRDGGLRYDITVIPPRMLGVEYVKTAGHCHPVVPGQGMRYPELYHVLEGEAHYLLQKNDGGGVSDVVLVKASRGDNVIIPPGYGHVTINASGKELKMGNWVCRDFNSDYCIYREKKGAAYFELDGGRLVANGNYGGLPNVRFFGPTNYGEFGLKKGRDSYNMIRDLDALDYLKNPAAHARLFNLLFKL